MTLPKRPRSKQKATAASLAAESTFTADGWIYRRQEDQDDYGVDAEVEIVSGEVVTGAIFKAQIRGRNVAWRNGIGAVRVKRSTLNLWLEMPVPVIVIVYDERTGELHWTLPQQATGRSGSATVTLPLRKDRVLAGQLDKIGLLVLSWRAAFFSSRQQAEVPAFVRMFRRLEEASDGDFFMYIDRGLDDEATVLVDHVTRLRYLAGLDMTRVIPMVLWRYADHKLGGQDDTVRYGILARLIDAIRPFYYEALAWVLERERSLDKYSELERYLEAEDLDIDKVMPEAEAARAWLKKVMTE